VWLDGEEGFRELHTTINGNDLKDAELHAADLTGRKLHLSPMRGAQPLPVTLFYLRAEPCDGPRASRRNLVATEDGHGVFWGGMHTIREIYKYFYPYRDSDFFRVLWGVFGGGDINANPKSRAATVLPFGTTHRYYREETTFHESIRKVTANGEDILETAVAAARDVGVEIHFYFRVEAFAGLFPHHGNDSRFYAENPHLRCRDEYGNEIKRISFAYREVQDHILEYFEELMAADPDGLCLAFNRGLPMMVCKEPVLDEFERRHGRRPRLPEQTDSAEMQSVRHELLAGFVERVHKLMAERGKALSCIIPRNFAENRRRGLDIELLLRRGLLESVCVGAGHEDSAVFTAKNHQPAVDLSDLASINALKEIGTAKVYAGGNALNWPPADPQTRAKRMRDILVSGLDGGFFWDTNVFFGNDWDNVRRYGDLQHVDDILSGQVRRPIERETLRVHDLKADRYSPWNAH